MITKRSPTKLENKKASKRRLPKLKGFKPSRPLKAYLLVIAALFVAAVLVDFFCHPPAKVATVCPVPQEFCDQGKSIFKDGKYLGMGFNLSPGIAFSAMFDGSITYGQEGVEEGGEKFPAIYLQDEEGNSLRYLFYGQAANLPSGLKVPKEAILGDMLSGLVFEEKEINLLLTLAKVKGEKRRVIRLSKKMFSSGL